jgi:hypothetical protein
MKFIFLLVLAALLPRPSHATAYPTLDSTSRWNLEKWGFAPGQGFYIQGAGKSVWTAPGVSESKMAFYNLALLGARLGGKEYRLLSQDYAGEMEGTGYIAKYGSFKLAANLSLVVVFAFHDDGKFESMAYFTGSAYIPGSAWELVLRLDYDMGGSGNNICEFLWSAASEGLSMSPPQVPRAPAMDGRLVFVPAAASRNAYWSASAHEISVSYPPMARESGSGVENAGFARILNASHPQFGMVLWGDEATSVEATFKAFASYDGTLSPTANVSAALQLTAERAYYPRYAYAGRDQMLYLKLGSPNGSGVYKFGGKLFQRADSRPLAVTVHQHPPEDLGGWNFDPDLVVRYTADGGRTFRNALQDLAGPDDVAIATSGSDGVPYLPYDGYAQPGQAITEAQLHNLMTATRDYSTANLENVRDWRLDLYLVNWSLQGEPDVWEAMFDYGGANTNGIAREGAAVFWPALAGQGWDYQRRQSVLSGLRGVGMTLNMEPGWSNCPAVGYCWNDASACGGVRCGNSCPSGSKGCRYSAHACLAECRDGSVMSLVDINQSSMRFNLGPASGSTSSEADWYRRAPEAWVKPGRFGAAPVHVSQLPYFIPN